MKCPNCNQEMEDRDVCPNCKYEIKDEKEESNEYNILANIILYIGIVIGIICGIGILIQVKDMLNMFITILLSICTIGLIITNAWYKSLILSAEDEKIKLLKEINANNKK